MADPDRGGFVRTTLVGGVLFLVPIVIIAVILEKALGLLDGLTVPLTRFLAMRDVAGISAPRLAAIVVLVVICFLAGLVARTRHARNLSGWLEQKFLLAIPGYAYFKRMSTSLAGIEDQDGGQAVLVSIEDAWQIAMQIERLPDGQLVIFVPGAPDTRSGSVYVMTPDRIRPLDASMSQAMRCLRRLGQGVGTMIKA